MQTQILVTVDHFKPITNLVDLVAGRAWSIDGVTNTQAVYCSAGHLPTHDEPEAGEEFVYTASGWVEL